MASAKETGRSGDSEAIFQPRTTHSENNQKTTSNPSNKPLTSIPIILRRLQKPQPEFYKTTTETTTAASKETLNIAQGAAELNDKREQENNERRVPDLVAVREERTKDSEFLSTKGKR